MNKNIIATILIIIAAGLYFTVAKPMIDDAGMVKTANNNLTSALNNADVIIKSRETVTKQYISISEADRAKLDKMIPSAVDNIRLVIDLNNLALQNHFTLSDVKATVPSNSSQSFGGRGRPGESAAPTPALNGGQSMAQNVSEPVLDKVQVSFSAEANYEQFISFLKTLQSDLRIMDMTHLSVRAQDSGTYMFQAQFQTYWLRQ